MQRTKKTIEMEDCWELKLGLSLWMRRLSWIRKSKELSVLLIIEKSSQLQVRPVCFI